MTVFNDVCFQKGFFFAMKRKLNTSVNIDFFSGKGNVFVSVEVFDLLEIRWN